jgi:hypothetical protein
MLTLLISYTFEIPSPLQKTDIKKIYRAIMLLVVLYVCVRNVDFYIKEKAPTEGAWDQGVENIST